MKTCSSTGIGSNFISFIHESSGFLIEEKHGALGLMIGCLLFCLAVMWWEKDSDDTETATIDNNSNDSRFVAAAKAPNAEQPSGSDSEGSKSEQPNASGDGKLRNVFSVKQRPMATGDGSSSEQSSSEKPFESSYYFAHNKHSTGGGYKDGLRAEDYVMNGPRLLSKGGVCVGDGRSDATAENDSEECIQSEKSDAKERTRPKLTASTPITKYMWDDDGSGNVAKIHIDSLPVSSAETTKWESAGISREQVEVRLIGEKNEGLHVGVVAHDGKRYHLHVQKMFGEAESVKCIVKKHKLLIKIAKKKIPKRHSNRHSAEEGFWKSTATALGRLVGGGGDEAKEEFISVAWPRLSAASAGGLGGGQASIDEKLFKGMDVTQQNGRDNFDM